MLQKVSIQNFKSLKDVTLELQKVNLLIGPNNSGKSNFLKALELIARIDKQNKNDKEIQLFLKLSDFYEKSTKKDLVFKMTLDKVSTGSKRNEGILEIKYREFGEQDTYGQEIDKGFYFSNYDFYQIPLPEENQVKWFMDIDNKAIPIGYYFKSFFNDVEIYKPNPTKLIKSFPILPNQSLVNNEASNLIAFFDTLRDEYPENFKAIENDLNKCIPELSGLRFENVEVTKDDDLYKIYGDKTFKRLGLYDKNKKMTYWADELSEGTLYFLALLCIVHQPNPPKLLLLEEPEKGIHPRRIREVLDFIFQLAEDKDIQVIMTTHSERVLDEFEDIPEAVFIFDKDEEGATQVKNLLKDIIEPSNELMDSQELPRIKFVESLGSHWVTGFIGGVPR